MKKILFFALMLSLTSMYGQKEIAWFDAGVKGMYGGSSLLNSAVMDAKNLDYELMFSNSYGIGGKFGINKVYSGLALEVMYKKGNAEIQNLAEGQKNLNVDWNALELYTLFRNNAHLGFFELGPKFSFIQGMERTDGFGNTLDLKEADMVSGMNIAGVLSFGVLVLGNDSSFSGQIGLRLEYGFTDIIKEGAGRTAFEPFPALATENLDYSTSAPIFAGLVFELNWGLGYYGTSQCGGRPKLFSF